jgi:hypothetical protein
VRGYPDHSPPHRNIGVTSISPPRPPSPAARSRLEKRALPSATTHSPPVGIPLARLLHVRARRRNGERRHEAVGVNGEKERRSALAATSRGGEADSIQVRFLKPFQYAPETLKPQLASTSLRAETPLLEDCSHVTICQVPLWLCLLNMLI